MSRKLIPLSVTASLFGGAAWADVPRVAADIAPVHSLVARVMQGVGEPELIMPPGESPHGFSLRPSGADALQGADLVFWIGEDLTPQLTSSIDTLAAEASVTALLEVDGITLLETRENALFEAHDHSHDDHADHGNHEDHGHDDNAHDDHGHDEHAHEDHAHDDHGHEEAETHDLDHDHGHEDHASHDDHAHDGQEDHAGHHDHAHGAHDPHAWLSLQNASAWLNVIAGALSAADPDNAGTYFANAAAAREEMKNLTAEIDSMLEPARGGSFIVFHDAYQYFETDFEIPASGAISLSDAADPSPARIAEIRARVRAEGVDCVLAEPQFNPGLVQTVLDGTEAETAVIDPLGASLEPGPDLYPQLIRTMAKSLADCFL